MANSPSDSPSGGGKFDPEQAEKLAELFQASWEALPAAEGPAAPAAGAPAPASKPEAIVPDRRGAITVPEAPLATAKRTLLGLPVPVAVVPEPSRDPQAKAPTENPAGGTVSKKTLLGVAPPIAVRPSAPQQSAPSFEAPPPPPPIGDEAVSPATKSSPQASRPSGVAKVYVPKEGPRTPAVVVDEAALRDGAAAAAAEEARRRSTTKTSRAMPTVRARPGEVELPSGMKRRSGLGIALVVLGVLGVGFAAIYFAVATSEPSGDARAEEPKQRAVPATADPLIPPLPADASEAAAASPQASGDAAQKEKLDRAAASEAVGHPAHSAAAARAASPPRQTAGQSARSTAAPREARAPAARPNAAQKRPSDASRAPAPAETKKPEPQKKSVIVRDTPF